MSYRESLQQELNEFRNKLNNQLNEHSSVLRNKVEEFIVRKALEILSNGYRGISGYYQNYLNEVSLYEQYKEAMPIFYERQKERPKKSFNDSVKRQQKITQLSIDGLPIKTGVVVDFTEFLL